MARVAMDVDDVEKQIIRDVAERHGRSMTQTIMRLMRAEALRLGVPAPEPPRPPTLYKLPPTKG